MPPKCGIIPPPKIKTEQPDYFEANMKTGVAVKAKTDDALASRPIWAPSALTLPGGASSSPSTGAMRLESGSKGSGETNQPHVIRELRRKIRNLEQDVQDLSNINTSLDDDNDDLKERANRAEERDDRAVERAVQLQDHKRMLEKFLQYERRLKIKELVEKTVEEKLAGMNLGSTAIVDARLSTIAGTPGSPSTTLAGSPSKSDAQLSRSGFRTSLKNRVFALLCFKKKRDPAALKLRLHLRLQLLILALKIRIGALKLSVLSSRNAVFGVDLRLGLAAAAVSDAYSNSARKAIRSSRCFRAKTADRSLLKPRKTFSGLGSAVESSCPLGLGKARSGTTGTKPPRRTLFTTHASYSTLEVFSIIAIKSICRMPFDFGRIVKILEEAPKYDHVSDSEAEDAEQKKGEKSCKACAEKDKKIERLKEALAKANASAGSATKGDK
ncbi:hypothetical protein BC567DRAFT_207365 [Phyllosticta citribraziliensis]